MILASLPFFVAVLGAGAFADGLPADVFATTDLLDFVFSETGFAARVVLALGLAADFATTLDAVFETVLVTALATALATALTTGLVLLALVVVFDATAGFDDFDFVVFDNLDELGLAAFTAVFFADAALEETAVLPTGFLVLDVDIDPQRR